MSEARSRRGALVPMRSENLGLIIVPLAITGRGGWAKEKRSGSLNRSKTWWTDGGTEKRSEHVLPHSSFSLLKKPFINRAVHINTKAGRDRENH